MQRIFNKPDEIVNETVEAFVKAHSDLVKVSTLNPRTLVSNYAKKEDRVGIVTGGGAGHEPAFIGYIGKNMVDAVAVGEIFSSPTAKAFADAMIEADSGKGVACLYGNYAGDNMNVKMATKMLKKQGVEVKTVVANDDVASAPKDEIEKRRGVAGEILMWKIGAAKASTGASLDEVIVAAQKAIDSTRSIGVGLTSCTIPEVGHANFSIDEGKMELGIGHHGEPGVEVTDLTSSQALVKMMLSRLLPDIPFTKGDEVVVLVSGLGATPINELYVFYNDVEKQLTDAGISIYKPLVGNFFTSLDMMGITLTVMKLDDELKELMDIPAQSVGLTI
ncbi:MAG: dihydroxyacetone kinase subunit DhaK [Alphaproteobacteria bacterium]